MRPAGHGLIQRMLAWGLGLFSLHLVMSLLALATIARDHRAVELDEAFLGSAEPLTVLIAGASHARNGIAADQLGGLSVAVAGEHTLKTRYRLPWLLHRSPRAVGAVILELDAATFSSWKADFFDPEVVWGRYVPYLHLGWRRGEPLDYAGKWGAARLAPYAGQADNFGFWRAGIRAFQDEDATDRFKGQPPAWMRKSGERQARMHLEGHNPFDPGKVWALRTLIEDLKARQVRVVLVSFPVTEDYRDTAVELGATMERRLGAVDDLFEPGVVDYLDFEDLYFGRDDAFYDGDHLSGKGRGHFTRVMYGELVELGIDVDAPRRLR